MVLIMLSMWVLGWVRCLIDIVEVVVVCSVVSRLLLIVVLIWLVFGLNSSIVDWWLVKFFVMLFG